ncbi:MAG: hypothetical protein E6G27_03205, partial [Actinobacteria bacterium]
RIADVFRSDTRASWLGRLGAAGCPAGPVLKRGDWLDHPQLEAIGMRIDVECGEHGPVVMPGVPVILHSTPGRVQGCAPPRATEPPSIWTEAQWATTPASTTRLGARAAGGGAGGPLAGVRVLDLGAIIAGPFAGALLAELGATVIKVEPLGGDSFRGPGFAAYNKGQRGLAIDLQHAKGREALLALARSTDIVIDNYRPGVLKRLGLDWSELREVNPDIVSVSITGFGDRGPLGGEPGFDPVVQAMSGMMSAQSVLHRTCQRRRSRRRDRARRLARAAPPAPQGRRAEGDDIAGRHVCGAAGG